MNVFITEIIKERNVFIVRVVLENGEEKVKREYRVSTELDLKRRINADISAITMAETEFPKLAVGPYDPTIPVIVPPPDPIPTREEIEMDDHRKDVDTLKRYEKAISVGIIDKADVGYLAHLDKMKVAFKPEFLPLYV